MSDQRLKDLWKQQAVDTPTFTPESLQARANAFYRTIRRRNVREHAAGAVVVAANTFYWWLFEDLLTRIACLLIIAGTLFVTVQLHRRACARRPSPEQLAAPVSTYHRAELVRQRDALRSVFFWYLLPMFPGIELFFLARQLQMNASMNLSVYLLYPALAAVIVWLNRYAAGKLQQQIDELDRESAGDSP
jgi:hypothetical protein